MLASSHVRSTRCSSRSLTAAANNTHQTIRTKQKTAANGLYRHEKSTGCLFAQIFDEAEALKEHGWSFSVTASFLEIYNETLYDLLNGGRSKYDIVSRTRARIEDLLSALLLWVTRSLRQSMAVVWLAGTDTKKLEIKSKKMPGGHLMPFVPDLTTKDVTSPAEIYALLQTAAVSTSIALPRTSSFFALSVSGNHYFTAGSALD
eukprot:COSAG05_NODE_2209_length_3393_cov_6.778351_1_plen_204_part_00